MHPESLVKVATVRKTFSRTGYKHIAEEVPKFVGFFFFFLYQFQTEQSFYNLLSRRMKLMVGRTGINSEARVGLV